MREAFQEATVRFTFACLIILVIFRDAPMSLTEQYYLSLILMCVTFC